MTFQAPLPTPESQKIQGLEGLRALMAWWVILGHLTLTFGLQAGLINLNVLAVDVFIILSGFVITLLLRVKRESYGGYLSRRFFRIFPLYLIVLAISIAMLPVVAQGLKAFPFSSEANSVRRLLVDEALSRAIAHIAVHVPLVQGLLPNRLLPDASFTIVGQAWSVSMEWQFYLIAPLVVFAATRKSVLPWIALICSVILTYSIRDHFNGGFIGQKLLYFAVGITSYLELVDLPGRRVAYQYPTIPWFALAITLVLVTLNGARSIVPSAIWWIAVFASVTERGGPLGLVRRFLESKPMIYLGQRSFSAYMAHMVPLYAGIYMLNDHGLTRGAFATLLIVLTCLSTLLISHLTFRYIEKPGNVLGAKLARHFQSNHAPLLSHVAP